MTVKHRIVKKFNNAIIRSANVKIVSVMIVSVMIELVVMSRNAKIVNQRLVARIRLNAKSHSNRITLNRANNRSKIIHKIKPKDNFNRLNNRLINVTLLNNLTKLLISIQRPQR